MYSGSDESRFITEKLSERLEFEEYRTPFRKDYARLIHCPSFRRLAGKTQLYPGQESDFFRNRLTHSIEVAQIAKSIAIRINQRFLNNESFKIDPDIVEFAALAHDLGHPPFGHQGEQALDEEMLNFGGFEGNAQTLRILTKLEKKIYDYNCPNGVLRGMDRRVGLNLTFRSIASIIKYDEPIPVTFAERQKYSTQFQNNKIQLVKGYYNSESEVVSIVKEKLLKDPKEKLKTIECQIMDIADDIAYSTYDLEDGLKAGFYNLFDIVFSDKAIFCKIADRINSKFEQNFCENEIRDILFNVFEIVFKPPEVEKGLKINNDNFYQYFLIVADGTYKACKNLSSNGYLRTTLTSSLVGQFIRGVCINFNKSEPILSEVFLNKDVRYKVEVLKRFNFESQISSPKLKIVEFRGKEIVKYIFKQLSEKNGFELLPLDCREIYDNMSEFDRKRIICDYISSMTDDYCIEFYGRLRSENPETIFKPLY